MCPYPGAFSLHVCLLGAREGDAQGRGCPAREMGGAGVPACPHTRGCHYRYTSTPATPHTNCDLTAWCLQLLGGDQGTQGGISQGWCVGWGGSHPWDAAQGSLDGCTPQVPLPRQLLLGLP